MKIRLRQSIIKDWNLLDALIIGGMKAFVPHALVIEVVRNVRRNLGVGVLSVQVGEFL